MANIENNQSLVKFSYGPASSFAQYTPEAGEIVIVDHGAASGLAEIAICVGLDASKNNAPVYRNIVDVEALKDINNILNTLIPNIQNDYLKRDGTLPMTGNLVMKDANGSHKITGLAAATENGDAVRFDEFNNHLTIYNDWVDKVTNQDKLKDSYVSTKGTSKMTGNLVMTDDKGVSHKITGLAKATANGDAVRYDEFKALSDRKFFYHDGSQAATDNFDMGQKQINNVKRVTGLEKITAAIDPTAAARTQELQDEIDARTTWQGDVVSEESLKDTYVTTSGNSTMAGNLKMGGNKVTGLAAATASGEAVRFDEFKALKDNTFLLDGSQAAKKDLSMGGHKLTNLADGTANADAVNKKQLDAINTSLTAEIDKIKTGELYDVYVRTDGTSTMDGNLQMGSNKITGLAKATNNGEAVRFDEFHALETRVGSMGTVMNFLGAVATDPADKSGVITINGSTTSITAEKGDVIISINSGKEFVYTDTTGGWVEIGDEGDLGQVAAKLDALEKKLNEDGYALKWKTFN